MKKTLWLAIMRLVNTWGRDDMSNVKVRGDGYHLARGYEGGELSVVSLSNYTYGAAVFSAGTEVEWAVTDFHWIADEPLDLEACYLVRNMFSCRRIQVTKCKRV